MKFKLSITNLLTKEDYILKFKSTTLIFLLIIIN
jgi:hypothetical protein